MYDTVCWSYVSHLCQEFKTLTLSSRSHEKNLFFLVHAFSILRRQLRDLALRPRMIFVGHGPARSKLEELMTQLQLEEDIVFEGHISDHAKLAEYYASADIFAWGIPLPSDCAFDDSIDFPRIRKLLARLYVKLLRQAFLLSVLTRLVHETSLCTMRPAYSCQNLEVILTGTRCFRTRLWRTPFSDRLYCSTL